jgi:NAD(P)-dependent dehydrogenase (short-subunit alcohol dehydrogenase family)
VPERHRAVNLCGTRATTQAFLPSLAWSGGAIVNNVSLMALAPRPIPRPRLRLLECC